MKQSSKFVMLLLALAEPTKSRCLYSMQDMWIRLQRVRDFAEAIAIQKEINDSLKRALLVSLLAIEDASVCAQFPAPAACRTLSF